MLKTNSFQHYLIKEIFVRLKGLEPPRLSAPDPKSGAATNYATAAKFGDKNTLKNIFPQIYRIFLPSCVSTAWRSSG